MKKEELEKENWKFWFNLLKTNNFQNIDTSNQTEEKIQIINEFKKKFKLLFSNNKINKKERQLNKNFRINFNSLSDQHRYKIILNHPLLGYYLQNKNDVFEFLKQNKAKNKEWRFYAITFYPKIKKLNLSSLNIFGSTMQLVKIIEKNHSIKNRTIKIKKIVKEFEKNKYFHENIECFNIDEYFSIIKESKSNLIKSIKKNHINWDWTKIQRIIYWISNGSDSELKNENLLEKMKETAETLIKKTAKMLKLKIDLEPEIRKQIYENKQTLEDFFYIPKLPEESTKNLINASNLDNKSTKDFAFDVTKVPFCYFKLFEHYLFLQQKNFNEFIKWLKENKKNTEKFNLFDQFVLKLYQIYIKENNFLLAGYIVCEQIKHLTGRKFPNKNKELKKKNFYGALKITCEKMKKEYNYIFNIVFASANYWFNARNNIMHFKKNFKEKHIFAMLIILFEIWKRPTLEQNQKITNHQTKINDWLNSFETSN